MLILKILMVWKIKSYSCHLFKDEKIPVIAEVNNLPYDARVTEPCKVAIHGKISIWQFMEQTGGRNSEDLGLSGMTIAEIKEYLQTGDKD